MNRKIVVFTFAFLALFVVPSLIMAQTTDDFEDLFGTMADQLERDLRGSIAVWRLEVASGAGGSLSDDAIWTSLDVELDFALGGSRTLEYRYQTALQQAIQLQTVTNSLAVDRINVAAIKRFGEQQSLDYLLDVRISKVSGSLSIAYRVLDLATGSLKSAGTVGSARSADATVLRAAEGALQSLGAGDSVLPVSVVTYGDEVRLDEAQRELVTLGLAPGHSGRIFDYGYLSRHVFQGTTDEEEDFIRSIFQQTVPDGFRTLLRTIGVNHLLTISTGPDGTIAKLIEVETGIIRNTAVVEAGMLSQMAKINPDDLDVLQQNRPAIGKTTVVRSELSNPAGAFFPMSTTSNGFAARRSLLVDYVQHILRTSGITVVDQYHTMHRQSMEGLVDGDYFDAQWRTKTAEVLGTDSFTRIDIDRDLLGVTVFNAASLGVNSILSTAGSFGMTDFTLWFAQQYARSVEQKNPLLLYSVNAGGDAGQTTSYAFRLLLISREISRNTPVIDPAFGRNVATVVLEQKPIDELTAADLNKLQRGNIPPVALVDIGETTYLDATQFYGRVLDTGSRTWPLIRMRYNDTAAQQVVREAFQEVLTPFARNRTARLTYQNIATSALPTEFRRTLEIMIESWLSTERRWVFAHTSNTDTVAYDVVFDDITDSRSDLEMYLRVLNAGTGAIEAIANVAVQDRVRRFDLRTQSDVVTQFTGAAADLLPGMNPVAVLVNPGFVGEFPAAVSNAIKQTLFEQGIPLVDTVKPNSIAEYDDQRVIYELGAGSYLLPVSYENGTALKAFDTGGFLVRIRQWGQEGFYDGMSRFGDFPALSSVSIGELSLSVETPYETVMLEEEYVRDALLAGLVRSRGSEVVDPSWATVFLQEPGSSQFAIEAKLADNPILYSINPSLFVVIRRTSDNRWFHVTEIPAPSTDYSISPGAYVPTLLDEVSDKTTAVIVETITTEELDTGGLVVMLTPDQFSLEEIPNRALYDTYQDPQFVLAAKVAARLYSALPRTDLQVVRQGRVPDQQTVVPNMNFQEWSETFQPQGMQYTRTYKILEIVERGGERIGRGRIEPDTEFSMIPPDQLARAIQLKALQEIAEVIEMAAGYAENVRISDLAETLAQAESLLPNIIPFPDAHAWARNRIGSLAGRLDELQGTAEMQGVASEAVVLIGNGQYKEARDLLRKTIRDLGESEILLELLQQSEDLPQGIIGRIRPDADDPERPEPIQNEGFADFVIAGQFRSEGQTLYARVTVRPNGVYRVETSGSVEMAYVDLRADGTRVIDAHPDYVVIVDSATPVLLTLTNGGRDPNQEFEITFTRDNDALYRFSEEPGKLARTTPGTHGGIEEIIRRPIDVVQYERHQTMRRRALTSSVISAVSFATAGYSYLVETGDLNGYQEDYDAAVAAYAAATTTTAALAAADDADAALGRQKLFRGLYYGGLISGGVTGLMAVIYFIADPGYPTLEQEGGLFGFDFSLQEDRLTLVWTLPLGN